MGADWIYSHSPVGLNLKTREFLITKEGKEVVTFVDETMPARNQLVGAKKLCKMLKKGVVGAVVVLSNESDNSKFNSVELPIEIQKLLDEYNDIFKESEELPPQRTIDHIIPLIHPDQVTSQRAYRLPHHKKNAMETLIDSYSNPT